MRFPKLKGILDTPILYLAYRTIVGGQRSTSIYVNEYVRPKTQDKVLDIGCGTGETIEHFSDVEYIGFDNNPAYIELAKKRFSDQGHFFCSRIDQVNLENFDPFDLVLVVGVLHHLDDQECIKALELAYSALKKGGRLISLDGCFVEEQSKAAKFIISKDRGLFMREKLEYQQLAAKVFSGVDVSLRHDLLKIPYTHLIMECTK